MGRMILHSDANAFYASVEQNENPALRGKRVAVGGDPELRHGIVLAKSYECKPFGVKTGMALWEAAQKCPGLIVTKPNTDLYMHYSKVLRNVYGQYSNRVEPFGLDEAWVDVSGPGVDFTEGERIAQEIRERVKSQLGITVSIGVADNKVYAKLGSDSKKPDAVTVISPENAHEVVYPLPVSDLLYIGPATTAKLYRLGVTTIGDLVRYDPCALRFLFGKIGPMLYAFACGQDNTMVAQTDDEVPIKSVGNSITTPHDICDEEIARLTLFMLSESVAKRMRKNAFRGKTVQIYVRDVDLKSFQRQCTLSTYTCYSKMITDAAVGLLDQTYGWEKPLRSMGVRVSNLVYETKPYQLDMFGDEEGLRCKEDLEREIDALRDRFGYHIVKRGLLLSDKSIGDSNPHKHIQIGGMVQGGGLR